jgi:hypothetical protein
MAQTIYLGYGANRDSVNVNGARIGTSAAGPKIGYSVALVAGMQFKITEYVPTHGHVLVTPEGVVISESSADLDTLTVPTNVADKTYLCVCRYQHGVTPTATYVVILDGAELATDTPIIKIVVPGGSAALLATMFFWYDREWNSTAYPQEKNIPINWLGTPNGIGDAMRKYISLHLGSAHNPASITFTAAADVTIRCSFLFPPEMIETEVKLARNPLKTSTYRAHVHMVCRTPGAAGDARFHMTWTNASSGASVVAVDSFTKAVGALAAGDVFSFFQDVPATVIEAGAPIGLAIQREGLAAVDTYAGDLLAVEGYVTFPVRHFASDY